MSIGIGAPRRMPVAEVTGLYGLIALIQDPKACKQRLDELVQAEKDAVDAHDKAGQAIDNAEKAEAKAAAAADRAAREEAAVDKKRTDDEAKLDGRELALAQSADRLNTDRADFKQRVDVFNEHVKKWDAEEKTRQETLERRERGVAKMQAEAEAKLKTAEGMLADAERRMALIRSAAA